jgi:hypothetical protein
MLPTDYTRCMGETPKCPERDRCARSRDQPENTALRWVRNLNIEGVEDCLYFIPYQS